MRINDSAPSTARFRLLAWMMVISALTCSVTPAHAISRAYRAQLERSGCTQMSDAAGTCDIRKTKAQNQANSVNAPASRLKIEQLIGKSIDVASGQLIADGWKANGGRWYHDNRVLTLTVADNLITAVSLKNVGHASLTLSKE